MSNKHLFAGGKTPAALTLDGTDTSQYSPVIVVPRSHTVCVHLVWTATTGSLNATAKLFETCIPTAGLADDTDWVEATEVAFTAVTGTDEKELVNIGNMGSGAFRLKFERSSGSGSVKAYWSVKKVS